MAISEDASAQRDNITNRSDAPSCLDANGQPGSCAGSGGPSRAEEGAFFSRDGRHDASLSLSQSYGGVAQSQPSGSFGPEAAGYLDSQRYGSFFDDHMADPMSLGSLDGATLPNLGASADGLGRGSLSPSNGHVNLEQPGFTFLSAGCLPGMVGPERPHPMAASSSEGLNQQQGLRPDCFLGRRNGDQVGPQMHLAFPHYDAADRHDVLLDFNGPHGQQTMGPSPRQHHSGLGSSGYLAYGQLGQPCDIMNLNALRQSFDHLPHVLAGVYPSSSPSDYSAPSNYPSPSKLVGFASSPASHSSLVLHQTNSANSQSAGGGSGNASFRQDGFVNQSQRNSTARDLNSFDAQSTPLGRTPVPVAPNLFNSSPEQPSNESTSNNGPASVARLRPRRPPCAAGSTSVLGTLLQRLHAIHNSADCRSATVKTQRKADAIAYAVDQLSSGELLQLLKNILAFQNTKTFTVSASAVANGAEKKAWDWTGGEGEARNGSSSENVGNPSAEKTMMKTFPMDDAELLTDELSNISGITDRGFLLSVAKWCQQQSPLQNSLKPTDNMKMVNGGNTAEGGRPDLEDGGQFIPALNLGPSKTEQKDSLSGDCGKQGFLMSDVQLQDDADFSNAGGTGANHPFGAVSRGMVHDRHGGRRCCCECAGLPQAKLLRTLIAKVDTLQQALKAHVDLQVNSLTAMLGSQLALSRDAERINMPFHSQGLSKESHSNATESTKSSSSSETFADDHSNDSGCSTQVKGEASMLPPVSASSRSGTVRDREPRMADGLSADLDCSPSKRQRCEDVCREGFSETNVSCSPPPETLPSGPTGNAYSNVDMSREHPNLADQTCKAESSRSPLSPRNAANSTTTDDAGVLDPGGPVTNGDAHPSHPDASAEFASLGLLKAEDVSDSTAVADADSGNATDVEQTNTAAGASGEAGVAPSGLALEGDGFGEKHRAGSSKGGLDNGTAGSPTPHDQCLLQLQALGMATPHWAEHEGSYEWHRSRLELGGRSKKGAFEGLVWEGHHGAEDLSKEKEDITEKYLRLFLDDLAATDALRLPEFQSGVMPGASVGVPLSSTHPISVPGPLSVISRQAISFLTPYDQDGRVKESWDVSIPRLSDSEAGALLLNQISVRLQQAVELIPLWIARLDVYRQSCDPMFRPLSLVPCHLQAVAFSQFFCTYAETSSAQLATLGNELNELVAAAAVGDKECRDGQCYGRPTAKCDVQTGGENKAAGVYFGGNATASSGIDAAFKCGSSAPSPLGSPRLDFFKVPNLSNAGTSSDNLCPYRDRLQSARFLRDSTGLNSSSVLISPSGFSMAGLAKDSLQEDLDGGEFGNEGRSPAHSPRMVTGSTGRRMMLMVCTAKPTAACQSTVSSISTSSVAVPAGTVGLAPSELPQGGREDDDDCRSAVAMGQSNCFTDSPGATVNATHSPMAILGGGGNALKQSEDPSGEAMGVLAPVVPSFPESDEKLTAGGAETSSEGAGSRGTGGQRNSRTPGVQGVVWKPEENAWIAFWQDPTTSEQQIRRFSVAELGEENARKMAVKCRRDADRQLSASVMASASRGASAKDGQLPRSEVPGVYWYRNRNGWVAQWFENGKNKHKFFAASVFGVEGAKQKAIAYRLMKLEEKKLHGW